MPFSLGHRLIRLLSPQPAGLDSSVWIEVQPPKARPSGSWFARLRDWLNWPVREERGDALDWMPSSPPDGALAEAREAFGAAVRDLDAAAVTTTLDHVGEARSLHELWHLRAEVFSLVSRARSQEEAARRLAALDRHFTRNRPRGPVRAAPLVNKKARRSSHKRRA